MRHWLAIFSVALFTGILGCGSCSIAGDNSFVVPTSAFSNPKSLELTVAAINGDESEVRQAISAGGNVNDPGSERSECSPLCWAIRSKRLNAVRILLANHADPDQHLAGVWQSPLITTVDAHAPVPILDALLSAGGDMNAFSGGRTAIMDAAFDNNPEAFEYLYLRGAKLASRWGDTDLLVQSLLGDNIKSYRFLLKHKYCTGYPYTAQLLGVGSNPPLQLIKNYPSPAQQNAAPDQHSAEAEKLIAEFRQATIEAAETCKNEHDSRVDKNKPKDAQSK